MIKKILLVLAVLPLHLMSMQQTATATSQRTLKQGDIEHVYVRDNRNGSQDVQVFTHHSYNSAGNQDAPYKPYSYEYQQGNSDTWHTAEVKVPSQNETLRNATSNTEYSWNQPQSSSEKLPKIPETAEERTLRNLDTEIDYAKRVAAQGTVQGYNYGHATLCSAYNKTTTFLRHCTEKATSLRHLENILRNALTIRAGLENDLAFMETMRQNQGIDDSTPLHGETQSKKELEQETLNNLNSIIDTAREKLQEQASQKANKKNSAFDSLSTHDKVTKLTDLVQDYLDEKQHAKLLVCEERIQYALTSIAHDYAEGQKDKSLAELQEEFQVSHAQWEKYTQKKEEIESHEIKTGKEFKKLEGQWKNAKVYAELELAKQEELKNLIQQKTYTPAYQQQLVTLKNELERKGFLTPADAKRVHALNQTLANHGSVSELTTLENSSHAFIGNDFQKQLYQESLNSIALAKQLYTTSRFPEQIVYYTQQAEYLGNWTMSMLQQDTNPVLASATADVAAGLIKQAQALDIAAKQTTTATQPKIKESDIAQLGELCANGMCDFSKGLALGAWHEVQDASTVVNNALTKPEETARQIVDNLQNAFDSYCNRKNELLQRCTGDGSTMQGLLKNAHPDALSLFKTQMQQYQEMGYSALAAETFVVSDILSAQKTEQSWHALSNTLQHATPGEIGYIAGRMITGTLLLDGSMQVLGGQLALMKNGAQGALCTAENAITKLADTAAQGSQAAQEFASECKALFDENKYYQVAGIDTPVSGKALNQMYELNQNALLRKADNSLLAGATTSNTGREIFLPRVETFEQARNKALQIVGDLGPNATPHVCKRIKESPAFGKVVGRESADHQLRWRVDWDSKKGAHVHVEDFRGKFSKNYVIQFDATEKEFKKLLKHLNR